jgi:DNA-binding HxlR family transcriptional regulator
VSQIEGVPDSVYRTNEAVGDAWSWLVMREAVLHGASRFADFQNRLGVARSTLSARLTQLVDGGLLARGVANGSTTPDRYHLTPAGEDFFGCLMAAKRWGDRWCAAGPPASLLVTHAACGKDADPRLRCESCGDVLRAQDVHIDRPVDRLGPARLPGRNHRAPDYELLERGGPCSIARTQKVIGDWWSAMVIREAFFGAHRFDEFHANLGLATNILASRLNRLVEHGILTRAPYQHRPTRHEYRLTEKGLALYPVPLATIAWGDRWKSPDGPPVPLTHRPCGQPLRPVLSCGHCGEPISRADVEVAYAPIAPARRPEFASALSRVRS